MRLRLWIIAGLFLAGCGQSFAPKNPLAASMPALSSSDLCPSQFNFETPNQATLWQGPSWALGDVGGCVRDSSEAACGQWSLKEVLNLSGSGSSQHYGLLFTVLPHEMSFDTKTLSVYMRFDPPPPPDLGVTLQFEDLGQNWVPTTNQPFLALKPGWNLLQRYFYGTQVQDIMALNFQVITNNGVPYQGTWWIDEVNW